MTGTETQIAWLSDPRLAAHAMSPLPAWLWSADASRMLWANPAGAAIFDAASPAAAARLALRCQASAPPSRSRGSPARCRRAAPPRLERLRGFGAQLRRHADLPVLAHPRLPTTPPASWWSRPSAPARNWRCRSARAASLTRFRAAGGPVHRRRRTGSRASRKRRARLADKPRPGRARRRASWRARPRSTAAPRARSRPVMS